MKSDVKSEEPQADDNCSTALGMFKSSSKPTRLSLSSVGQHRICPTMSLVDSKMERPLLMREIAASDLEGFNKFKNVGICSEKPVSKCSIVRKGNRARNDLKQDWFGVIVSK